ncbi:MAG TPA: phosphoribosylaminoimidazolesuccinocarboxamide synthase [Planctomycetota bacterium]|nr:phosphoribosylaminoimidazolesuccinocarboxamide synthase [Planctomycetota bacterium]
MSAPVPPVVLETNLEGLPPPKRGKVRDVYDLGEHLLIVATDRISAFDVVLPNGIPDKGKVLTRLTAFWLKLLNVPNHLITDRVLEMPKALHPFREALEGRSMFVEKLKMFPIECVVRGYISGSGWTDYGNTSAICGVKLPEGLQESECLPGPIFTPATKAEKGHDENIGFEEVVRSVGARAAEELRERSLEVYDAAAKYARPRGIILADTKLEWGSRPEGGPIVLGDEVLTPDSSRFWPLDAYAPGKAQPSFDKQYVRDYLMSLGWKRKPPGPELPAAVVEETARKYREIYELLTGTKWEAADSI